MQNDFGGVLQRRFLRVCLANGVMINEDLARRRGEALENQILISRVEERMQDGVVIVGKMELLSLQSCLGTAMIGLNDSGRHCCLLPLPRPCQRWQNGTQRVLVGSQTISVGHGGELQVRFE